MNVQLKPGTYVVAVSGGVDSMALLHRLAQLQTRDKQQYRFIVAHFDHGIRPDSAADRQLVQATARKYQLPFVYAEGNLGPNASEAVARDARYDFLKQVRKASGAHGIVTAHHQDDLIESALLNIVRGTGRRGVTAMIHNRAITRPLLHMSKEDIVDYAEYHQIPWREDSTNQDVKYRRNQLRHNVLPKLTLNDRQSLIDTMHTLAKTNHELEAALINILHMQPRSGTISRHFFTMLPHDISKEVLASLLRSRDLRDYDRKLLERLTIYAKTAQFGRQFPIMQGWYLEVGKKTLALRPPER